METVMLSASLPVTRRRMAVLIWFIYNGTLCIAL